MNSVLRACHTWLAFSLLLLGCNTSGLVGGECARGLSPCDQTCVNLGSDEDHCGACDQRCASDETCRAGVCLSDSDFTDPSGSSSSETDGSSETAATSGGVDPLDGGTSTRDADPTTATDGATNPCFPPYNSAENCGACGAACGAEAPFCAPAAEGFECVDGCEDPLRLCGDRCVDTTTDPLHCGRCGNACPTGLCSEGECVGGQAGHLVAICMSYEQLFANSSQGVLLANAVFLATNPTTRIMMFDAYAPSAAKSQVRASITSASVSRRRPVQINTASSVDGIVQGLNIANYDVLVIADTSLAPSGALRNMGRALSTTIDTFTRAGGIVVVTAGAAATEMPAFWGSDGANLFEMRGVPDITFTELENRAPSDALTANVLTPFLSLTSTCAFDMDTDMSGDTRVVIAGPNPGDAGGELPVVLHRVMLP